MYQPGGPCEPPGTRARLWRYMSLAKFIDLLETSELHFTLLSRMEDGFEGALSTFSIEHMRRWLQQDGSLPAETADHLARETYALNQHYAYVNCWHASPHESVAMWKQYGSEGIAIRTSFARFRKSLEPELRDIYIGKVQYGNYRDTLMNYGNTLAPVFHKRRVFKYEREVRAVHFSAEHMGALPISELLSGLQSNPPGLKIRTNVHELVEKVYVSPGKQLWYGEMVARLLRRYHHDFPIEYSSIDKRPIY